MRLCVLLAAVILVSCLSIPQIGQPAQAIAEHKIRIAGNFESDVNETNDWGVWHSVVSSTPYANASVTKSSAAQYIGTYSALLSLSGVGGTWAEASHIFKSNQSLGHQPFDHLGIYWRFNSTAWLVTADYKFDQYNDTTLLSRLHIVLVPTGAPTDTWNLIYFTPNWEPEVTNFTLTFHMTMSGTGGGVTTKLWLDYFYIESDRADVRVRYWNLYTGLGYYEEKLLARYYSFPEGWTDVWRGEFQSFKGDEILLQVTDIFGRNVWTGMVSVDSDPVYVDILVPIVTVYIPKPDWYNDSVPMEWRITCLPWGPDGPAGMELPVTGFMFEVLAGWYNLAWFKSHYVEAGNQTVYIDGNLTARRSFMLTNISIPINPEYDLEVNGGGITIDLKSWSGFFNSLMLMGGALWDDYRIKALSLFLTGLTVVGLMWRAKHLERKLARRQKGAI